MNIIYNTYKNICKIVLFLVTSVYTRFMSHVMPYLSRFVSFVLCKIHAERAVNRNEFPQLVGVSL
jgi:hypothetical protein